MNSVRVAVEKQHSTRRRFFQQEIGIMFEKATSEVLHLEHSFVCC